jgi:hypothetical protein
MLVAAVGCFAVAALGGIALAYLHLSQKKASLGLAALHGLLAVAGVVTLLICISKGGADKLLTVALALFVVAALGGLVLFAQHLRARPLPVPILLIHALVAVGGFLTLLAGVCKHAA